jgi:hypothetical protein
MKDIKRICNNNNATGWSKEKNERVFRCLVIKPLHYSCTFFTMSSFFTAEAGTLYCYQEFNKYKYMLINFVGCWFV